MDTVYSAEANDVLLTFNSGSSTLKIGAYELLDDHLVQVVAGKIDFDSTPLILCYSVGKTHYERELSSNSSPNFETAIADTLDHLLAHLPGTLAGVAHRVVHGGMLFRQPILLTDEAISKIRDLTSYAPLHQPAALRVIDSIRQLRPGLAQTASFDTAFHATRNSLTQRLAIPRELHEQGVRRYGFHGLSYKFIAGKLREIDPSIAGGRIIAGHLGSGASICALRDGISHDCSMGFSALDGIPMATRPGWIDPGVLLYLLRNGMSDPQQLEGFLYHQCGLLGVSGISPDTRVLLSDTRPEAKEAIDLFCFRIAGEIARQSVTLGGIDALVFTAGIGEHQPEIRQRIVHRLEWLGIHLNAEDNDASSTVISMPDSRIKVFVIPTDEESIIAEEALSILRPKND